MDDSAFHVATSQKFPRFIFGFEALDPAVLIYHPTVPKCVECAVGRAVYSVTRIFNHVDHDASSDAVPKTFRRAIEWPHRAGPSLRLIGSELACLIRAKI